MNGASTSNPEKCKRPGDHSGAFADLFQPGADHHRLAVQGFKHELL